MENLEQQLGAVLGNPEMMQQIMSMAQSFQTAPPPQTETPAAPEGFTMPDIDIGMVQQLTSLAGKAGIDSNQKNLLHALSPYLSNQRITKLEKAMRAAKIASMASGFLGKSGILQSLGR